MRIHQDPFLVPSLPHPLYSLFLPLPLEGWIPNPLLGYSKPRTEARFSFRSPVNTNRSSPRTGFESRARSVELTRLVGGQLGGHWSTRCARFFCERFFFFPLSLSLSLSSLDSDRWMDGWILTTVTTTCASCCLRFKANRWWLEGARGRVWRCRWCGWCCIRDGCPLVGVHLLVFFGSFLYFEIFNFLFKINFEKLILDNGFHPKFRKFFFILFDLWVRYF